MSRHLSKVSFGLVSVGLALYIGACGSGASPAPPGGTAGYGFQLDPAGGAAGCVAQKEFGCGSGGAFGGGGDTPGNGGNTDVGGTTSIDAGKGPQGGATALACTGCTEKLCPGASLVNIPVSGFKQCNMKGCNTAHCVPVAALPKEIPVSLLSACEDPTTVCVPDDYTATFGKFLAQTCKSILGAEGRCISTCIGQVNGLMDALPKDNCGDNERCAPCINPNDGKETGACTQGCDPGQSKAAADPKFVFPTCAHGEGRCVEKSIIPAALLTQLVQTPIAGETGCPSAEQVCAPVQKSQNLKYNFPKCTPGNPFTGAAAGVLCPPGPNGQAGGCVPSWLADTNPIEGVFLQQDTCATGEKCAPCNNPLRFCPATGACAVPLPSDPSGGLPPAGTSVGGASGGTGTASTGGGTARSGGAGGAP